MRQLLIKIEGQFEFLGKNAITLEKLCPIVLILGNH
jgi:hypothetical protein